MPNCYPLKRQLDEKAAQEETQGLVQFVFFRPHLAELLQVFAHSQVDLLVLKGAALAETLYPRPSLRPFGDLDLLIRDAQAVQARTLLERLGYAVDPAQWEDLVRGRDCQANFFKPTPRGSVVAELHTRLINNSLFFPFVRFDLAGIWRRARPASLAGVPAHILGPEDLLLHLCLHLAGHYLAAPQSLRDIAQLCDAVQSGVLPLDWMLFLQLARQSHAPIACFCGLYVAKCVLGADVPDAVITALSPGPSRKRLEALAAARAIDMEQTQTDHLRLPLLWHLMGHSRLRLGAARRILFPSQRWLALHYYYDRFERPALPRFPQTWRGSLWESAQDAARFLQIYPTLFLIHWGTLVKQGGAVLFRISRR